MSTDIEKAIKTLTDAMQDTELGSYAHSWHCNIAMSFYDELCSLKENETKNPVYLNHGNNHYIANKAASRFMKLLFNVNTHN